MRKLLALLTVAVACLVPLAAPAQVTNVLDGGTVLKATFWNTHTVPRTALAGSTAFGQTWLGLANDGAARDALGLGTAAGRDVGVGAENVVALDGNGALPAVDGSQLLNLPTRPPYPDLSALGFVGDSITAGDGADIRPVTELISLLTAQLGSAPTVVNAGVSGSTSADWASNAGATNLAVTLANFQSAGVKTVLLMLGTNDAKTSVATSPVQYAANLRAITAALLAPETGIEHVVLQHPPYVVAGSYGQWDTNSNVLLRAYGRLIDTLSAPGAGVWVGDTAAFQAFEVNPGAYLGDGVHPTAAGSSVLASLWLSGCNKRLTGVPPPATRTLHLCFDGATGATRWSTGGITATRFGAGGYNLNFPAFADKSYMVQISVTTDQAGFNSGMENMTYGQRTPSSTSILVLRSATPSANAIGIDTSVVNVTITGPAQ